MSQSMHKKLRVMHRYLSGGKDLPRRRVVGRGGLRGVKMVDGVVISMRGSIRDQGC